MDGDTEAIDALIVQFSSAQSAVRTRELIAKALEEVVNGSRIKDNAENQRGADKPVRNLKQYGFCF